MSFRQDLPVKLDFFQRKAPFSRKKSNHVVLEYVCGAGFDAAVDKIANNAEWGLDKLYVLEVFLCHLASHPGFNNHTH